MNCEKCHGTGMVVGLTPDGITADGEDCWCYLIPCEECGGTGKSHCCDGLKEQPEKPE